MTLSAELRTALPSSIDSKTVRAAVRAPGSPGSLGGETWLLDLDGGLAAVYRASIFDPLEPLALAEVAEPVALRGANELEIHRASGESFMVRPSLVEIDAVRALLAGVDGLAPNPNPAAFDPGALVDASVPVTPHADPITLTDLDVVDPQREAEVTAAITAGQYRRANAAARKLAAQSSLRERDEWNDLVKLIASLEAGEFAAAYLWARGVRRVPVAVHDAVFARMSLELEHADEPLLAWAAAGDGLLDRSVAEDRRRDSFEQGLGLDGPALEREVAERARRFFTNAAKGGDRLAQRGLAQALLQLDELPRALKWIRRAIATEAFDFDARMLETQILGLIAIETGDDSELLAALREAATHFHDRPEPLVALADQLEFDDPAAAIDCLRQALDREFDEFVLLTLIRLFESNRRWSDVIREVEAALSEPDSVALVEDELRAQLSNARAKFAPPDPSRMTLEDQPPTTAATPRSQLIMWALLPVIVMMILGWLLAGP